MQAPINPPISKRKMIDKIEISNFKFFPSISVGADNKPKAINVEGKHLLIYGENGSGKSSLYWALYTLLECANKPNKEEIQKYFEYDGNESLVNINAVQSPAPNNKKAENAYVKIGLKDDDNSDYIISYDDVAIRTKLEAQISNFASDFINYRVLYSAFNYAHSEEVDLYHHFKHSVFPYVKFDDPCTIWRKSKITDLWSEETVLEANPIIEFLEHGAFYEVLSNNKLKYTLTKAQVSDVKQSINNIKATLQKLLTHINTKGNEILKNLGYPNLDFKVEYAEATKGTVGKGSYASPKIQILLKNTMYEGKADKVHRIHSFFNEAKLTAVSLAIRLAVLEKKPSDAQLKILVLDDLMISLDMNNRTKVIDYVFKNYLSKYQTFILTHDKSLFDFIQLKIAELDKMENWAIKEMYCGHANKPVIIEENLDFLSKAKAYFNAFDYYSAGNNIRKAIEKKLKSLLPETVRRETRDLEHELKQLFDFYDNNGCSDLIPTQLRLELSQYKNIVFNPSSHFDLRSPLYKCEIEKAFEVFYTLDTIPKLSIHLLAGMRASLFYKNEARGYAAEFILIDNLYAVVVVAPDGPIRLSNPEHRLVTYSLNGVDFSDKKGVAKSETEIQVAKEVAKDESMKISKRLERITHFIAPPSPISFEDFTLADGRSLEVLKTEINKG